MLASVLTLALALGARAQEGQPDPIAPVEQGVPAPPPPSPEQTAPEKAPEAAPPPPPEAGPAPAVAPPPAPEPAPPTAPSTAPAAVAAPEPPPAPRPEPNEPISGMVLMPTAYRGIGRLSHSDIGMSLDINAAYYIGRVYGKNEFPWTLEKTNFIDRIGQWMLMADGKMQVQSEGPWRPALAFGAIGLFAFRDAPQPTVGGTGGAVKANVETSDRFGGVYMVGSKRFRDKFVTTVGYMQGDIPSIFPLLSEFLTPNALAASGHPGRTASADGMLFGGLLFQPRSSSVYGIEVMKPQNMVLDPWLVNFNLGTLLKLNFQLSYLRFQGGWDLLGMIQFRYNQFPRR